MLVDNSQHRKKTGRKIEQRKNEQIRNKLPKTLKEKIKSLKVHTNQKRKEEKKVCVTIKTLIG